MAELAEHLDAYQRRVLRRRRRRSFMAGMGVGAVAAVLVSAVGYFAAGLLLYASVSDVQAVRGGYLLGVLVASAVFWVGLAVHRHHRKD